MAEHNDGKVHFVQHEFSSDVSIFCGQQLIAVARRFSRDSTLTPEETLANARRLVASWNHCIEFGTEVLESGPTMLELVQNTKHDKVSIRSLVAIVRELFLIIDQTDLPQEVKAQVDQMDAELRDIQSALEEDIS